MKRRFAISVAVLFAILFASGWLVHGGLLKSDFAQFSHLQRPAVEVRDKILYVFGAQLITALAFTWIYLKGREAKPWLPQGVRFGLAAALLVAIPSGLLHHAVMPFPLDFILKTMLADALTLVLMGIAVAFINRTPAS